MIGFEYEGDLRKRDTIERIRDFLEMKKKNFNSALYSTSAVNRKNTIVDRCSTIVTIHEELLDRSIDN